MEHEKEREKTLTEVCSRCGKPFVSSSSEECCCEIPDASSEPSIESEQMIAGRFRVVSKIGQGGMGQVYKVVDSKTDQTLALKVLKKELSNDKQALKRFEQEAQAASGLTHDNVVTIYESGQTEDGSPYILMEYVDGKSLAEELKHGARLSDSRAVEIFIQVAQALTLAHNKGIIHRDLKPSNIMLSGTAGGSEIARILDFGIAKIQPTFESSEEATALTQTGEIFGSPLYMSPEQCEGNPLDARSDIYSLGCVMYETLSGVRPFEGANPVKVILNQLNKIPESFSSLQNSPSVKKDLETIVLKCLAKDPAHRYQSINDVLQDLHRVKWGRSVNTRLPVHQHTREDYYPGVIVLLILIIGLCLMNGFRSVNAPKQPVKNVLDPGKMGMLDSNRDAMDFDSKSFAYYIDKQYEKAAPLLEFGVATYKERLATATGKDIPKFDILLAENLQHLGKCYVKMGDKKVGSAKTELYKKALAKYQEAMKYYSKYGNWKGSTVPEFLAGYKEVAKRLNNLSELSKVESYARQYNLNI